VSRRAGTQTIAITLLLVVCGGLCFGSELRVPAEFPTIQEAVDSAVDGDLILVSPGVYYENLVIRGKSIVLKSLYGPQVTVIDGGKPVNPDRKSVVMIDGDHEYLPVIEGFTLRNGAGLKTIPGGSSFSGGAIYCRFASAVIRNNIIIDNHVNDDGGAILAGVSDILIEGNVIENNSAEDGGAIFVNYGRVKICNNIIRGNQASVGGGGIDLWGPDPGYEVRNNLICDNHAPQGGGIHFFLCYADEMVFDGNTVINNSAGTGGGAHLWAECHPHITNSIFAGNSASVAGDEFYLGFPGEDSLPTMEYSVLEGGLDSVAAYAGSELMLGPGVIFDDPLLCSGPEGDAYLSQVAAGQPVDSPCIDAGHGEAGLLSGTTRTDHGADAGWIDIGFHYQVNHGLVSAPGPGPENPPVFRVSPLSEEGEAILDVRVYGAGGYGLDLVTGDLDGDGNDEILTGAGPGAVYGPHVRGFECDGTFMPGLSFLSYGTNRYGVHVAAGDLDGDGDDEIITGPGPGVVFGPHVRAFDYDDGGAVSVLSSVSFFAYGTLKYGVQVTAGDLDGDGRDEIITGAGPGVVFGPHVRGWQVTEQGVSPVPGVSYFAYGTPRYGVHVAAADLDGDGIDEILTAPGPGPGFGAQIRGWQVEEGSVALMPGCDFFAWTPGSTGFGAFLTAGSDRDLDGRREFVVGKGPDARANTTVRMYEYTGDGVELVFSREAFPEGYGYGAIAAAGRFHGLAESSP